MEQSGHLGRCEARGHLVDERVLVSVKTDNGEELHCTDCFRMKMSMTVQRSQVPAPHIKDFAFLHYFHILDVDGNKSDHMISIEANYYLFELNKRYKVTIEELD